MTRTKSTKRALLMSALALLMCVSMFVGSTFAWFTDSVTSSGNKIVAGTLDVDLYLWNSEKSSTEITNESAPIFGGENSVVAQNNAADTLWEPGKTQVVYLSIKNNGNLDLKYKVALNVMNPDGGKDLYKVMEYDIIEDATYGSVSAWNATDAKSVVLGTNTTQANNVELKVGVEHFFALAIHMDEDASNEYQGGQVTFDISVLASQLASESDSFDSNYDQKATYSDGVYVVAPIEEKVTSDATTGEFVYESTDDTVKVSGTAAPGAEVAVVVAPVSATKEVTAIVEASGKELVSYDIDVSGQADGSDVTVDLFIGKGLIGVEVYHAGVKMDTGANYDPDTGYLSITTTSFSAYEVVYLTSESTAKTNQALAEMIADGVKEITLGAGTYKLPSTTNNEITLIGCSKDTIIDLSYATGQSLSGTDVTLRNLTVTGANQDYVGLQHVGNVVYDNVIFNGSTNLYGESVTFKDCTFNLTSRYIWTYGAKVATFNNCTFNTDGKAILAYKESDPATYIVNIKDCIFNATQQGKTGSGDWCAAVEIDSSLVGAYVINFEGENKVSENFNGLSRIKSHNNNNATIKETGTVTTISAE